MEVDNSPVGLLYVFDKAVLYLSGPALACVSSLFKSVGCVVTFFITLLAPANWFKVVSEVSSILLAFIFADLDKREKLPDSFTCAGLTFLISLRAEEESLCGAEVRSSVFFVRQDAFFVNLLGVPLKLWLL
uniref:Uncharacterized protein n=1 Tax=Arundo donax TaxID=35708 RepID=A0A0A8Y1N5_ARUDO